MQKVSLGIKTSKQSKCGNFGNMFGVLFVEFSCTLVQIVASLFCYL